MPESRKKKVSRFARLRQWFENHIIQEAPEHYQICEFSCREFECSMGNWEKCEKRLRSTEESQERS